MDRRLLDLAESQLGLLSRDQILETACDRGFIQRRLARGDWLIALPNVYRLKGVPTSLSQRMIAALLWAGDGAALSHTTAGLIWGFESMPTDIIHVTTNDRRKPPAGVKLHYVRLEPGDVVKNGNIRSTSAARTLIDLGSVVNAFILGKALDIAMAKRLVDIDHLAGRLASCKPGHRGSKQLRKLLGRDDTTARSVLERKLFRLLQRADLPCPEAQFTIDLGPFVAHVDFAYPEQRVVIECQGFKYHGGKGAWARDAYRHNLLTMRGWRVLQITWADVIEQPDEVIDQIRNLVFVNGHA